jgi:hypothetical protein
MALSRGDAQNPSVSTWLSDAYIELRTPTIFASPQIHRGVLKVTNTTVQFLAPYTELGAYLSDPSTNYFTDLTVGPSGYLTGGAGDNFFVSGNFTNNSAQNTLWSTAAAELDFIAGGSPHTFALAGADQGRSYFGYNHNFAWGIFRLRSGQSLVLGDGNSTRGAALYATRVILDDGISEVSSITGNSFSIYYDPADSGNSYLLSGAPGGVYSLSGGGVLAPVQPVTAVSRMTHGSAGTFDINLPTSGTRGVECRKSASLGAGNYTLVFTFPNNLTSVGSVSTNAGSVSSSSIGPNPNQYTVNLTSVANQQYIIVTLTGVVDATGGSGNVSGTMGVLIGDVNASGRVDAADVSLVRQQTLQPVSSSNFREDVNASGRIDAADVSIVRQQTLTSLP